MRPEAALELVGKYARLQRRINGPVERAAKPSTQAQG